MKKLAVLLLCLFLIPFAASELIVTEYQFNPNVQFSIHSSQVNICACGFAETAYTLRNVGSQPDRVTLSADKDFVAFSQTFVDLQPGEAQTIIGYIHGSCQVSSQDFTITLSSIYGQQMSVEQEVNTVQCQNLAASLDQDNVSIGVCDEFSSTLTIQNIGNHRETYSVTPKTFSEYASISQEEITIESGKSGDVAIFYKLDCNIVGDYELDYLIKTQQSKLQAKVSQELSIDNNYDYSVELSQIEPTCALDQNQIVLSIENRNHFTNFFDLDISAPNFIDIQLPVVDGKEVSTIVLNGSSATEILLNVNPTSKKQAGNHTVEVSVTPKYGPTNYTSTEFTIYNCYDFEGFFADMQDQYFCGGDEVQRTIDLTHAGYGNPGIRLEASSEMVSFDDDTIDFLGQETRTRNLYFEIPDDVESQDTEIKIDAYFRGYVVDSVTFDADITDKYSCYETRPTKFTSDVFFDSEYFTLDLQNIGDRDTTYDVSFNYAPSYLNLETDLLETQAGKFTELLFSIDRDSLQEDADLFNNGSIIGLDGYVQLQLDNPEQSYTYNTTVSFIDYPWYTKTARQVVQTDACILIFGGLGILVLAGLVVFVVRLASDRTFKSNSKVALIVGIILIVAAVILLLVSGVPTKDKFFTSYDLETNSTLLIYMQEDQALTLNANKFFFDPDMDIETFDAIQINESILTTSSQGENLTLTPADNWYGTTEIELFVEDSYGEIAVSDRIIVQVLPVEDYTLVEFFLLVCMYVNLILLWALGILIYLSSSLVYKKADKQTKLKVK